MAKPVKFGAAKGPKMGGTKAKKPKAPRKRSSSGGASGSGGGKGGWKPTGTIEW